MQRFARADRWLVLIVVAGLCLYLAWSIFVVATNRPVDYYTYLVAARALSQGQNIYLASPETYAKTAADLGITTSIPIYRYPLLTAMVAWPFTRLPLQAGAFVWVFGSGVAALSSGLILGARARAAWQRRLILAAVIGFTPVLATLHAGQINAYVLLATAMAIWLWRSRSETKAGACLALGLWLKPLAVALPLLAAWRLRWRVVAAVVVTGSLLTIGGIAAFGLEPTLGQIAGMSSLSLHAVGLSSIATNQNLNGMVARHLGFLSPQTGLAIYVGLAVLFGLSTLALLWPSGSSKRPIELEAAFLVVATHLVMNQTWYHHLTMVLIAFAVLVERWDDWRRVTPSKALLAASYVGLSVHGIAYKLFLANSWMLDTGAWCTLVLWALLAVEVRRAAVSP
jgi:hypothetical protein